MVHKRVVGANGFEPSTSWSRISSRNTIYWPVWLCSASNMLIWAAIRQQSDSNRTQLLRSQDRPFDRFVPRIRSSAELIAMNSHMPDQDNLQERLKTAQEECRQLREENAHLRAMLGINQSPPKEPVPQAVPVANLSSTKRSGVSTPEETISLFRNLFRG